MKEHKPDCPEGKARSSSVPIECGHGTDVCPQCDPCLCLHACAQPGCDGPANYRYTWPGRNERRACFLCALKLAVVADAIGLHLQLIPLTPADYLEPGTLTMHADGKHVLTVNLGPEPAFPEAMR